MNRYRLTLWLFLIATVAGTGAASWAYAEYNGTLRQLRVTENARGALEMDAKLVASEAESTRLAVERAITEVRAQLAEALAAKEIAEASLQRTRAQLTKAESDKNVVEGELEAANHRLAQLRAAIEDAEHAAAKAKDQLAQEHATRERAEQAARVAPANEHAQPQ